MNRGVSEHDWDDGGWPTNGIDIGSGQAILFVTTARSPLTIAGHEHAYGLLWYHRRPDGAACSGGVAFEGNGIDDGAHWTVESEEPLTLAPSIHCVAEAGGCGMHGWIREGRWVQA